MFVMPRVLVLLLLAVCARAGEYAVLASGARLRVDRHEEAGGKIRLFMNGGSIELDAAQVAGFEKEDYVPPKAVAAAPVPRSGGDVDPRALVDAAAKKYGIDEKFLHSVVKAESGYRVGAVSPKGAIGLMQLMPETARSYGADATDPAQNVETGTRYLAELLTKYGGGVYRALAAYNAGPGAVAKYNGGIPPYRETQEYIRRIMRLWRPQ